MGLRPALLAVSLALAAAAGAGGAGPAPAPCLSVRRYPDGPVLLRIPLPPDGAFALVYRHSVERTPVVERYRVARGEGPAGQAEPVLVLVLEASEYRSLGAGLPAEGELREGPEGPVLVIWLRRTMDSLVLRPLPLTEHALRLGDGRRIPLPDGGAALELRPGCEPDEEEGGHA